MASELHYTPYIFIIVWLFIFEDFSAGIAAASVSLFDSFS